MLMVEHHMEVVTGLAQRIAVMHHGALLACDTPSRGDGERDRAVGVPRGGALTAVAAVETRTLLEVRDLHVNLGQSHVLQGVSFDVPEGGVTALLGRNGVGKTTTLRAILGLVGRRGTVQLGGEDLTSLATHRIVRRSVGYVPEDRDVFAGLTVAENLRLAERDDEPRYDLVYDLFPELGSGRRSARARSPAASSRWSRSRARC